MPTYKYIVRDKHGNKSTGLIEGETRDEVAKNLEGMGYTPISIEETRVMPGGKFFQKIYFGKLRAVGLFTRQLATLIKSGLPVLGSLSTLEKQTGKKFLKQAIGEVAREVEAGNSFSSALERHPRIFNELYTNTVKAGETSGTLDEVLDRLADLIEHEIDTRSKILGVVLYPSIATCFLFVGFLILVTYVIPQFVKIFDTLKGNLPLPTLILIRANFIIQNYWYIILILSGLCIFGFFRFIKTKYGRKRWDKFKLKVPVLGPVVLKLTMSRFSRIVSILTRSGVPILTILEVTGRTTGNVIISQAIDSIRTSVNEGKGMAEPMGVSGVFSPMVVQMVSVGEETGRIDELLYEVSMHYDREAAYTIKNLATIIEPILIVILALGVLIMALGVFLPMWNMFTVLRGA